MSDVVFDQVTKSYGNHTAVRHVDFTVRPGEFVTLLGPSGCGKTTCLRMVAGFVRPSSGRILMGGGDVTDLPPYRRSVGMVFQSYALFPHQTVAENIAFGLKVRRVARQDRDRRTLEALRLVRLERHADRYPAQLSGGQKQRVALARAVVIRPDVLLLDEPLAALDLKLREELQVEIKKIQSALAMTTLFVTHDQGEALSMSDRIAVMNEGVIVQMGTPAALYERPNSRFVANFVGKTNLIEVVVLDAAGGASCTVQSIGHGGRTFEVRGAQSQTFATGERCFLATRPASLQLGSDQANHAAGIVRGLSYLGNVWQIDIEGSDGEQLTAFRASSDNLPAIGEAVAVGWQPDKCFLIKASDDPIPHPQQRAG